MAQKNRKVHSDRGGRSSGYGNAARHRGAGSRGGRGNAGSWTHHQKRVLILGLPFGKTGFKRHASLISSKRGVNLFDIDSKIERWVAEGKAKKSAAGYSVDLSELGYDKVLGGGQLTKKIEIKCDSFSESAKKKIEEKGGKVLLNGVDTA